jgi:hypothetical protein
MMIGEPFTGKKNFKRLQKIFFFMGYDFVRLLIASGTTQPEPEPDSFELHLQSKVWMLQCGNLSYMLSSKDHSLLEPTDITVHPI